LNAIFVVLGEICLSHVALEGLPALWSYGFPALSVLDFPEEKKKIQKFPLTE